MKNDKICINKSVMFIAVVGVILLGVVMTTNYVNNQKVSTNSRAATVAEDVTPTPIPGGTVVMSGLALSDLKTKADAAIKKLENVLTVTLNKDQVSAKKLAITSNVTAADGAFINVQKETENLKDVAILSETTLRADISNQATIVSNKEGELAIAKRDRVEVQNIVDANSGNLQQKQTELNAKLADVSSEKGAVDAQRRTMDNVVSNLLNSNTSTNRATETILNDLNLAKAISDTAGYISALNGLKARVLASTIFGSAQKSLFSTTLGGLVTLQTGYISKQAQVPPLESEVTRLTAELMGSKGMLQGAIDIESEAAVEFQSATDKKKIFDSMLPEVTSFESDLLRFTDSLVETSALPASLTLLAIPNPDFGAGTSSITAINNEIVKVNAVLLAADSAYVALDKVITEGMTEQQAQMGANEQYCRNVVAGNGQKLWPVLTYDQFGNVVGDVPPFVASYYEKNCKPNYDKPLWNGRFGAEAKCYKTVGICSLVEKPIKSADIINVGVNPQGNPESCINREVDINECIKYRAAPNSVGETQALCKKEAKYGWVGKASYTIAYDVRQYLGAQIAPTRVPSTGLSDACVLLRPNTATPQPCMVISPRFCQLQDDGYKAKVDSDGNIVKFEDKKGVQPAQEAIPTSFDQSY